MKGNGEKERYTQLNAEVQRIARRNKKAFFSDQCKEIEENNRMGKTRDLFKKIRDNKDGLYKGQKWYGPMCVPLAIQHIHHLHLKISFFVKILFEQQTSIFNIRVE